MTSYSTNLKALVSQSKLSQRVLSEKLGIDESTLSMYLSGKRTPGLKNHMKICSYFKVNQNFFLHDLTNSK